jgi:hypothetical protein
VAGKSSYTVGPVGCDVTAPKPIKLYSAYYRDSGSNDYPVEVIDITQYNNLIDKNVSAGAPEYVAYDAGDAQQTVGKGTCYVYITPDQVYTLNIEVDNYLTEFVNLTDIVTFEPAYYEALIYNLAVRLFRFYRDASIPVPADILMIAQNSINNLKAMNGTILTATMELPGKQGSYNIYNDSSV